MADFLVVVLKLAFLVILWAFVFAVALVIRNDFRGDAILVGGVGDTEEPRPSKKQRSKGNSRQEPKVISIESGNQAGTRLQLVEHFRIGRSAQCALILDDDYVSGDHADLERRPSGDWVLTDLGSTNGSFVNGVRVVAPTVVTPADTLRIGRTQMRLET